LTDLLTPYVPRIVLEWDDESAGERVRVVDGTLVFVDVSGFTRMSERLARLGKEGAEEIANVIGSTFEDMLAVAYRAGGSLLKFGGDALLLAFTGPGHVDRGCFAAHGMRSSVRRIGALRTSAGNIRLGMSEAVHCGPLHLFLVGSAHRELVVGGPAASRLVAVEAAARTGEILLSHETARLLDRRLLGAAREDGVTLARAPSLPDPLVEAGPVGSSTRAGQFVPAPIREHVAGGGVDPEHRPIAIAFLSFGGLDECISDDGADEAAARLERVVTLAQEAADRHGVCFLGTDIAPDGGKILLVSGAPRVLDDDEERLLRTVRAVVDADPPLPVRAGMHAGHAFAGDIGPAYRRTYTVMGDVVNTAARVMTSARPGQALATAAVLDRSAATFATRELPPFAAKGKSGLLVAYEVGALRSSRRGRDGRLPFVGRDAELEALRAILDEAREGRGRVIEIVGEPGIGKSRLLAEFRAASAGVLWLTVRSEQYQASTPYFAFRPVLAAALGLDDGRPTADALERAVRRVAPELVHWLPLLALPFGVAVPPTPVTESLDPDSRRDRMQHTVRELLGAAFAGPAVLVVDDAQWTDEASKDLLHTLVPYVAGRPWLVCVARRPGPGWWDVEVRTIDVGPLPPDASKALVRAATEGRLLPQLAEALANRGAGNPLFCEELAVTATAGGGGELPSSVEAVIAARIDRLAPRDRAALRQLSVLGASFERASAAQLVGGTPPWARLRDFLDANRRMVRFRQGLVREVAYEGLPFKVRRAIHERAGVLLEPTADRPDRLALLSHHFHAAQRYDRSWRYSVAAAEQAREAFAHIEAATLFGRALEAAQRIPDLGDDSIAGVSRSLGEVLMHAGRFEQAAGAFARARKLVRSDAAATAWLFNLEGQVREELGRYAHAMRWYGRGLRAIASAPDTPAIAVERIRLRLAAAGVRYLQGRFAECVRRCLAVLPDAEALDDPKLLGLASSRLCLAYIALGDPAGAHYGKLALAAFERTGQLRSQGEALNNLGIEAHLAGRWDEALALYRRSRETLEQAGCVVPAAVAASNAGEILSDQGRLDEAAAVLREAASTLRAARSQHAVLVVANLGRIAARTGRFEDATSLIAQARDEFEQMGARGWLGEMDAREAENLVLMRRASDALQLIETRLADPPSALAAPVWRLRGYAHAQAGDLGAARDAFERSLAHARQAGAQHEEAWTLDALSRLDAMDGIDDRATAARAGAIFDRLGVTSPPRFPPFEAVAATVL
jgi:class 3 adenylate cyclase/tetratricopeptide (TPR) repeat protein